MCLIGAPRKVIPPTLTNVTLNCRNGMLGQQVRHDGDADMDQLTIEAGLG